MKTIVLLTHSAALHRQLDEAFGRRSSVVLLPPPPDGSAASFQNICAPWFPLADAFIVDGASLGESAQGAIEAFRAYPMRDGQVIAMRLTGMQRAVCAVPDSWIVVDDKEDVTRLQEQIRHALELREARHQVEQLQRRLPRPARPESQSPPESLRYREALKQLSAVLATQTDPTQLWIECGRWLRDFFGVHRLVIYRRDGVWLRVVYSCGTSRELLQKLTLRADDGLGAAVMREGCILRAGSEWLEDDASRQLELLGALAVVPVDNEEEICGLIACGAKINGTALGTEDLELMHALARQVVLGEQRLRQARRTEEKHGFLQRLVADLPVGLVLVDGQQRVLEINARAREWLGLKDGLRESLTVRTLPSPVAGLILQAQQTHEPIARRELELPALRRPLAVQVTELASSSGEPVWLLLVEDLTAWRQQQQLARQAQEQEFFSRVAFRLSHELKNALVSIKIFGQLLPERYNEKDFREQFSNVVVNEVNRVDVLINNLTFFSQPLGLVYEDIALNELVDACLKNLTHEFARKKLAQLVGIGEKPDEPTGLPVVTVKRTFTHKCAQIEGDRIRLTQALEHVLRNAVQSMPKGGRLTISTADAVESDLPSSLPVGGAVKIEVTDTGEGIS
ncbi:MAG: PAS domain-containing protein, partial [Verrucomicrobiae bacterium]|nr:PAS domain-containing protein [Verrucomicrobiae bacterium]